MDLLLKMQNLRILVNEKWYTRYLNIGISVAYRYRKSISIIELFVSIYIDIYRVLGN